MKNNRIRRLVKFEIKLYELDQIIDQLSASLRFQESALRLYTYKTNCNQAEFRRVFKKNEKDYCRPFGVESPMSYRAFLFLTVSCVFYIFPPCHRGFPPR